MHIRNVRIDWMLMYGNGPHLTVEIDGYDRDAFRYEAIPINGSTFYHARNGLTVRYMIHDPLNERGFGGLTFALPMKDGSIARFRGAWSSSSAVYHHLVGGPHVVEVGSNEGAICVTVEALNEALARCVHPGIQLHPESVASLYPELSDEQNQIAEGQPGPLVVYRLRKSDRDLLRLFCERCGAEAITTDDHVRRRHAFSVQHRHTDLQITAQQ